MQRWLYALSGAFTVFVLFVIAALIALAGEIQTLDRQVHGSGSTLSLALPTRPALAVPTLPVSSDASVTITSSNQAGTTVSVALIVQASMPVDLFSTAPLIADASGKGYAASKESIDKASLAALDLSQRGMATLALDFPVGDGFIPTTVIFNNASSSPLAPVLKAAVPGR